MVGIETGRRASEGRTGPRTCGRGHGSEWASKEVKICVVCARYPFSASWMASDEFGESFGDGTTSRFGAALVSSGCRTSEGSAGVEKSREEQKDCKRSGRTSSERGSSDLSEGWPERKGQLIMADPAGAPT